MKKIFTFFIVCACASMMSAQTVIAHTPIQDEVGMGMGVFAENMSPNTNYVVGLDQATNFPIAWDRTNDMYVAFDAMDTVWDLQYNYQQDTMWNPIYNEDYTEIIGQELAWNYIYNEDYTEIIDSTCVGDNYAVILSIDTLGFYMEAATGSFHAVTNSGIAVGELGAEGNGKPIMANIATSALTHLPLPEGFVAGSAYAISADGQTIAGFCYDAAWYTVPCLWTNGGQDVTILPIPEAADMGFDVEYASVRYMSEDASILMGYAQDYNNGDQIMVLWRKNAEGDYTVDGSLARTMYNSNFVEWIPAIPYSYFEGTCLSANGEWVGLKLSTNTDPFSWEVSPENRLGRYNTTTGALEYISLGDFTGEIFGIANDGTAVGTYEEMGLFYPVSKALLWKAGETEAYEESEVLVDSYFTEQEEKEVKFSAISADGQYVLGKMDYIYTPVDEEGAMLADPTVEIESFIIDLNMPASVESVDANVNANVNKRLENNQIVIEKDGVRYSVLGKVLSAK